MTRLITSTGMQKENKERKKKERKKDTILSHWLSNSIKGVHVGWERENLNNALAKTAILVHYCPCPATLQPMLSVF